MSGINRICGACGHPLTDAPQRRPKALQSPEPQPERESTALKSALHLFIAKYGKSSADLLDRAQQQWYGADDERAKLLDACFRDSALLEACEIVNMAGAQAAKFLGTFARQAHLGSRIDFHA